MASPPRAPFGFRAKLTVLAVTLVSVPLAVAGVSLFHVNADAVKTLARELQLAILEDVARTIDAHLDQAETDVTAIARALTDAARPQEARLSMAVALVEAAEAVDQVSIFDAGGRFIDRIAETGAPRGPELLPDALRTAAARDGTALGSIELFGADPRLPVVAAIRAGDAVTGFVVGPVSLAGVQARIDRIAMSRFPDRSGSLYVLDDELRYVAHPDRELILTAAGIEVRDWIQSVPLAADVARSGEIGDHAIGSTVKLRRLPWTLVAELSRRVAYASLTRMERTALVILAASLAVSIALALVLARRVSRPVRQLSELAGALSERRFDQRIEIKTRDELSILARAMNGAAADLAASEAKIRQEMAIRTDLGRYLPGELVDKVVRREQDMALGGARRAVTVLFADVVGFTPLTDRLGAEEVVALLNELFTILTEIVFRHGGTVDKFIGDCVMAMWGAPAPQDDHARRALAAATDMMSWLEAGNAAWEARLGIRVELAVGINTGDAIVGNIGSDTRMEYTAIGDVVNVAARLETIARPQQILVTAATRAAAGDAFDYGDLGDKSLPGRAAPIHLYEVRP